MTFEEWAEKRGVWPRLTHEEIWNAAAEANPQPGTECPAQDTAGYPCCECKAIGAAYKIGKESAPPACTHDMITAGLRAADYAEVDVRAVFAAMIGTQGARTELIKAGWCPPGGPGNPGPDSLRFTDDVLDPIRLLLAVARAADAVMGGNEEGNYINCSEADAVGLSFALGELEAKLPDNKPGYTLSGPAKAEWALRDLLTPNVGVQGQRREAD